MIIYDIEKQDGLTELISAQSSIVYASLAEKFDQSNEQTKVLIKTHNKALAKINDSDLYYTQSILVTTSWNKNDDIFNPLEVWAAKNTPEDKPTNLEHDENVIVGHITSNWPIDDDGNIIEENTDAKNLPDKFHILTGSVIYKGYTDPELRSRANTLIEEIENGNKYVSMECFFKDFDYGLIDQATGKYHILPRNEETAFLTKHLRSYGGAGQHENYKIGRVLRNITFSGKGFVNKPANPESIIFTKDNLKLYNEQATIKNYLEKNATFENNSVFLNQASSKEINMSIETEQVQTDTVIVEVNDVVTALKTEHELAAKKMKEDMNSKEEEMKKMKAALETLQLELDSVNEALAGYKAKEQQMLKQEKKSKRMASLIDSGIDAETAEATVDKFENLDDDTFASITQVIAAKKVMKNDKEDKETASVVAEEVLETAEVTDNISLNISSDENSQAQTTRAALVDFVSSRLGKKLNKGE